ncbi:MAG: glycerophosphodiester phosphodiesterase [Candidatus Promineifilaceae bacterium]|nr:glycerophosphodiester phosphodiesterase [Candidatus Promineifilaceae bacterium]
MRSPTKPYAHQGDVVILAHRGFSGRFPENTLLAFSKAAELPIDGLEMDIHATKDGVLVISHDDSVARMTNGQGCIQEYSLAALKELDAGYHFSPDGGKTYPFRGQGLSIPSMAEVLERFPDLWINVDIKQHEKRVVEEFCRLIEYHGAQEQLCVGSFSSETVQQFRRICPQVVTLATRSEILQLFLFNKLRLERWFKGGHAMQISPQHTQWGITMDIATPHFIEAAHRRNTAVHLWTLDDEAEMRRFVQMGADGIITNYPDRALRHLGRLPPHNKAAVESEN